jgi:CheY-like chemotaxis protein
VTSDPVRCVLVIDDSGLIRQAAELALGRLGGLRVLSAESGEQGLALVAAEAPDAVLLDVVMPGMSGIEVAEQLLAGSQADAPAIVFLTATDRVEELRRLRRLPVAGLIAKPFDVATLNGELHALLGWSV